MPLDMHTVQVPDLSGLQNQDLVILAQQDAVANSAAGAAGGSVTVAVTFGAGQLPSSGYAVLVTPSQAALVAVPGASKTSTSFNVVLTSYPAASTLAAGTFDVIVIG